MANPIKIARSFAGIVGKGGKNVKPVYNEMERKARKRAAVFAAGFAGTSAWIGNEIRKSEKRTRGIKK
jgi:hypothetical protein